MKKEIDYVLADPCGNTTILILNSVETCLRSIVATQLLQKAGIEAEQAGFLTVTPEGPADLRINMMGGEFCGNASRSAAVYVASMEQVDEGNYRVSCSGCEDILQAHVSRQADGVYNASITMPLPSEISAVLIDVGGIPCRFYRVDFGGIVHFVYMGNALKCMDKETYWEALHDYAGDKDNEAVGLILFNPNEHEIIPAVYVTKTDTLYWEQSCGSGSAAVAAVVACMGKRNFETDIFQPGGAIHVTATWGEDTVEQLCIGGPIRLVQSGNTSVDIK